MDCQICQNELDGYLSGRLDREMNEEISNHLAICANCQEIYRIQSLADNIISFEKRITPDIDLSSKIMGRLEEEAGYNGISRFTRLLKPVFITSSVAAAIFAGVLIGNIYNPSSGELARPVELTLIDDAAIESVNILSNL